MAKKNPYLNDRDILDQALEHSWGKTADAKAKEKAYNREYYQRHKEEILRKARQAGEGIQRTAQNAYNTARREAHGIRDAVTNPPRRSANPTAKADNTSGWHSTGTGIVYNSGDFRKTAKDYKNWAANAKQNRDHYIDRYKEALSEGNRGLANEYLGKLRKEHTDYKDGLAISKSASNKYAHEAKAKNEAAKAKSQRAPESRFDSKFVRDAQNAYSKVRPGLRKAKNAAEDAINTAKNNAQAYIDNAMGKNGRRGSNIDTRQLEIDARKARSKRNRINKSAQKASARSAARTEQAYQLNSDPKLRNGQFAKEALDNAVVSQRDAYEKAKMAKKARNEAMNSAAAYNQAQNAANRAGYDTRYDSKLVRDFQNARAKARDFDKNPGKYVNKARDSVDQFVNNALSKTKKKKKS